MEMQLKHKGEFLSLAGKLWRVEILQEAARPFETVGSLTFPADEPLLIEWIRTKKEDVVCGSTATLQIVSPGDRTYIDLYSIAPGNIRLDVYLNNSIYWSGALDPEFYEEPYHMAQDYEVSLTFSDFGILNRLKYEMGGLQTIQDILHNALIRSRINYAEINQAMISTEINGGRLTLSSLKVRSDNFFDEDGEASTMKAAIEGIFQPLGLRLVQRSGKVYVYDLNGLYTLAEKATINWDGDSSTMGVDKVANNVKITWSTYAQSGNQAPEGNWTETIDANKMALNNLSGGTSGKSKYFSYHYSNNLWDWIDATDCGFTLWIAEQGKNATINHKDARYFSIVPQYDGSEEEGIALVYPAYQGIKVGSGSNWSASLSTKRYGLLGNLPGTMAKCGAKIFTSAPVWIPPITQNDDFSLRISLSMLLDCRFNPFEQAANIIKYQDEKDWYNYWNARGNFVYVPVTIKFQPDDSDIIFVWDNRGIVKQSVKNPIKTLSQTYGEWQRYNAADDENPDKWGYLCYYDNSDRAEKCGVMGWKKNRPAINPHTSPVISILEHAEEGQYIPYPSGSGGKLWIELREGSWQASDGNADLSDDPNNIKNLNELWTRVYWLLVKAPEIEIVNSRQFEKTINTDDIEYTAELNAGAKDDIELDTICGMHKDGVPTARGAYFNALTGEQVRTLTRAGRTTQAEKLLIGTLYSQYAERKTTLEGETLINDALHYYIEQNQGEKRFVIMREEQDVISDCADSEFCELRPDEYEENL